MAHSTMNRPFDSLAVRQARYPVLEDEDEGRVERFREPSWSRLLRTYAVLVLITVVLALLGFLWLSTAVPVDEPMVSTAVTTPTGAWNWPLAIPGILLTGFVIVGAVAILRCGSSRTRR